jgi:hypothetical protein
MAQKVPFSCRRLGDDRKRRAESRQPNGARVDTIHADRAALELKEPAKRARFSECFPRVCPEPVLAKSSFLYEIGFTEALLVAPEESRHHGRLPCSAPNTHTHTHTHITS